MRRQLQVVSDLRACNSLWSYTARKPQHGTVRDAQCHGIKYVLESILNHIIIWYDKMYYYFRFGVPAIACKHIYHLRSQILFFLMEIILVGFVNKILDKWTLIVSLKNIGIRK